MRLAAFVSLVFLLPATAFALPEIGKPAPAFTTTAIDGAKVSPAAYKGKIVVLEWNNPGCPFVHKHYDSGNMQKLQAYAHEKGAVWLTVNSSAAGKEGSITAQDAKDYVSGQKLASTHYLLDPEGAIGRLYGAKSTPHMFVIDANGNMAYMGAIDEKPDANPASIPGAVNYVRAALDSLAAGKPVATPSTQSYGCSVKYAD